ncbi:MAG: 4Fe-4S dicluster domain-containing protein [Desulfovibrionaceae bacterium]
MSKTLYIDYNKCIGCETCEAVCKTLYDKPRINMTRTTEGVLMPLYCRHCDRPACANVCPRGALIKAADGSVILQPLLCAGCESKPCLMACPFGGVFTSSREAPVTKCDLCTHRRAVGMGPACVEMCPCQAIQYVEREAIPALQTEAASKAEAMVLAHIRPPSTKLGR